MRYRREHLIGACVEWRYKKFLSRFASDGFSADLDCYTVLQSGEVSQCDALECVLGQGYPVLDYVVMDGGSTDNSVDIIKQRESELSFWRSEPDRGQAAAINEGFARSSGAILAWLNSDAPCFF
jgi:Glycosyl transferase family 2